MIHLKPEPLDMECVERCDALVEAYMAEGLTDGLPVIVPTEARVAAMVRASGEAADAVLGRVPPSFAPATMEKVAINAVLAGCVPQYMPVVVAALRAMLHPSFHYFSLATSTKGCAPLVIVNGPCRGRLGVNAGACLFGPGHRANATIGRALYFVTLNIGGDRPGLLDRSTLGHPGKYTYCIGEDEEDSPWQPLGVELGAPAGSDTVTVFAGEGLHQINNFGSRRPEGLLLTIADSIARLSSFSMLGRATFFLVLAKEHRAILREFNWSKDDAREFIYRHARRTAADLRAADSLFPDLAACGDGSPEGLTALSGPEALWIVAAGGAGRWSAVIPGMPTAEGGAGPVMQIVT